MDLHPELSSTLDQGDNLSAPLCNKDTGQKKQLRKWTRGHLFVIRGGGHIDMWQPLYQYVVSIIITFFILQYLYVI